LSNADRFENEATLMARVAIRIGTLAVASIAASGILWVAFHPMNPETLEIFAGGGWRTA